MDWNSLINAMLTGLFVGVGSSLGTWLVTRNFIRHLEKLEGKLKKYSELSFPSVCPTRIDEDSALAKAAPIGRRKQKPIYISSGKV